MWHAKPTDGYDRTSQSAIDNATEIYNIFHNGGYTDNAIYAILGAFQAECDLNPWQWEGVYNVSNIPPSYDIPSNKGYGFPQFTPPTVYINGGSSYSGYAPNFSDISGLPSDGNAQCLFILDQINTDYFVNSSYHSAFAAIGIDSTVGENLSLNDFKTSTSVSLLDLSVAFFTNYLRPAQIEVQDRFLDDTYNNSYYGSAEYWYQYFTGNPPISFVPRFSLEHPAPSPWYTPPDNWYAANGYAPDYGITYPNGNCTWYAYGRYAEIRNGFANLSHRNAGYWYEDATAFQRGDFSQGAEPRLGAIVCFKDAVDPDTYVGHVTVVEQINNDGTIVVSQSGYTAGGGNTYFWTSTVSRDNQYRESWYTQGGRNYYCQGFIYNDVSPIPPVPPVPSLSTKMPLWMMCLRKLH